MKLYICSFIKDNELLKKYNEIWEKVKNSIKKEFDTEPVYNEKYVKAKIKSYNGKIDTNFHNNKIKKEGSHFICLLVILIDSAFLKQVKIIILKFFYKNVNMLLKKIMPKYITHGIEISSDSDREDYSQENSAEENSNNEN